MKQIEESARKTPVLAETEVLVIGDGPSGLSAAVSLKHGVTFRNVNISEVQEVLKKQGVRIE